MRRLPHPTPRLDHVMALRHDWTGRDDYYRLVLGAVLAGRGDRRALWFGADRELRRARSLRRPRSVPAPPRGADLCLERPCEVSPRAAHARPPVTIELGPARSRRHGGDVAAWVRDPDGDIIELVSYRDEREA